MNWAWLKSVGMAFVEGAVIAAAGAATAMATDGFTGSEFKILGAVAFAGGLGGVRGLFRPTPRDPDKRERATDRMNLDG